MDSNAIVDELGFAIKGKSYVICALDANYHKNDRIILSTCDKFHKIAPHTFFAAVGDAVKIDQFSTKTTIQANKYLWDRGHEMNCNECNNFGRQVAYDMFRNNPDAKEFSGFLCGYDEKYGPMLNMIDHTGNIQSCASFDCIGLARIIGISLFDKFFHPNMTENQSYNLMKLVAEHIKTSSALNVHQMIVKIVDKYGIRRMQDINLKDI